MLQCCIHYSGNINLFNIVSSLQFKYKENVYELSLPSNSSYNLTLIHDNNNRTLWLHFPEEVNLEDTKCIHETIKTIASHVNGTVEDDKAHIGYDKEGRKVFIFHRFSQWIHFIQKAKYHSLHGQKIMLLKDDEVIEEGILVSFEVNNHSIETMKSCTIITLTGEKTIYGDQLSIQPANI